MWALGRAQHLQLAVHGWHKVVHSLSCCSVLALEACAATDMASRNFGVRHTAHEGHR